MDALFGTFDFWLETIWTFAWVMVLSFLAPFASSLRAAIFTFIGGFVFNAAWDVLIGEVRLPHWGADLAALWMPALALGVLCLILGVIARVVFPQSSPHRR